MAEAAVQDEGPPAPPEHDELDHDHGGEQTSLSQQTPVSPENPSSDLPSPEHVAEPTPPPPEGDTPPSPPPPVATEVQMPATEQATPFTDEPATDQPEDRVNVEYFHPSAEPPPRPPPESFGSEGGSIIASHFPTRIVNFLGTASSIVARVLHTKTPEYKPTPSLSPSVGYMALHQMHVGPSPAFCSTVQPWPLKFHRDAQTVDLVSHSQQTMREQGTQMVSSSPISRVHCPRTSRTFCLTLPPPVTFPS